MTATAARPARSEPEPGLDEEARIARLRAANINPRTGLPPIISTISTKLSCFWK